MRSFSTFLVLLVTLYAPFCTAQLDGPDAPLVSFSYSLNSFTLTLDDPPNSNNFNGSYTELEPGVPNPNDPAQYWRFQGYIIYQVLHDSVSNEQLRDAAYSRIVAQSDIQDTIIHLFNTYYDSVNDICIWTQMVTGQNVGSQLIFTLQEDAFTGQPFFDPETYCFVAIAYASNLYLMDDDCPNSPQSFLASTRSPIGGVPRYCVSGSSVGIEDPETAPLVSIYPNPSSGTITIDYHQPSTIQVMDATGRILLTRRGQGRTVLDLSAEARGLYFVEITGLDGIRSVQRLEIQ